MDSSGQAKMNDTKRFRDFYAEEANVYHRLRYESRYGKLFQLLHHEGISETLGRLDRDLSLLEVACGTGHTSALLVELGFSLLACDLTPEMLTQAMERVKTVHEVNGKFLESDVTSLPFPDSSFDLVVSTRFLHLFPHKEQRKLLREMLRILRPGGYILVDFDNWSSRWIMALPYLIYNLVRYRRIAPYSIYNRINPTKRMFEELGVRVQRITGIGGTHLILPALISQDLAFWFGRLHKTNPLRILAEQFIVFGTKS